VEVPSVGQDLVSVFGTSTDLGTDSAREREFRCGPAFVSPCNFAAGWHFKRRRCVARVAHASGRPAWRPQARECICGGAQESTSLRVGALLLAA